MSGLSPASVKRLEQLEAKGELEPSERGELRSLTHSAPTAEQRLRIERVLLSRQHAEAAPSPVDSPSGGEAYQRGLERGRAAGGRAYTRGTA